MKLMMPALISSHFQFRMVKKKNDKQPSKSWVCVCVLFFYSPLLSLLLFIYMHICIDTHDDICIMCVKGISPMLIRLWFWFLNRATRVFFVVYFSQAHFTLPKSTQLAKTSNPVSDQWELHTVQKPINRSYDSGRIFYPLYLHILNWACVYESV